MGIKLEDFKEELQKCCPRCNGKGNKGLDFDGKFISARKPSNLTYTKDLNSKIQAVECKECSGRGKVLSELAKQILDFFMENKWIPRI